MEVAKHLCSDLSVTSFPPPLFHMLKSNLLIVQVLGPLPAMWETQPEILAPDLGLIQLQPAVAI